jgi:hypothetical protein
LRSASVVIGFTLHLLAVAVGLGFYLSVAYDPRHGLAFDLSFAVNFTNAKEAKVQFTIAKGGETSFVFLI